METTMIRLIPALLLLASCAHIDMGSPMDQYISGVSDGIRMAGPGEIPQMVLTWDEGHTYLGECRQVSGMRLVYIHVGQIVAESRSPWDARAKVKRVVMHEIEHARASCSDADHARSDFD
jgi:hypothetical protein